MSDPTPPLSPWKLTPPRILLLAFGLLALVMIVGALMGGVANYAELRQAAGSSSDSSGGSSAP